MFGKGAYFWVFRIICESLPRPGESEFSRFQLIWNPPPLTLSQRQKQKRTGSLFLPFLFLVVIIINFVFPLDLFKGKEAEKRGEKKNIGRRRKVVWEILCRHKRWNLAATAPPKKSLEEISSRKIKALFLGPYMCSRNSWLGKRVGERRLVPNRIYRVIKGREGRKIIFGLGATICERASPFVITPQKTGIRINCLDSLLFGLFKEKPSKMGISINKSSFCAKFVRARVSVNMTRAESAKKEWERGGLPFNNNGERRRREGEKEDKKEGKSPRSSHADTGGRIFFCLREPGSLWMTCCSWTSISSWMYS